MNRREQMPGLSSGAIRHVEFSYHIELSRQREVVAHVLSKLISEIFRIAWQCAPLVAHKDKRLSKRLALIHQTNDAQVIAASLNE